MDRGFLHNVGRLLAAVLVVIVTAVPAFGRDCCARTTANRPSSTRAVASPARPSASGHACCATRSAEVARADSQAEQADHPNSPDDSHKPCGSRSCAAVCCQPAAVVPSSPLCLISGGVTDDVVPPAPPPSGRADTKAIFHPPRA